MALEYTSKSETSEYYLTPKEVGQLINAEDTLRNRLVIELLYECGIRRFELCGIEIKHLNIPKREIYIWRGKGGNPKGKNDKERIARYVFIKEERIMTDFKAYLGSRTTGKLIQSTNKSKDGIDYSGINRILAHVAKLAGMKCPNPNRKNIHPYMLRHSFGRREDLDLASKQKIMGHSDFRITANFYGKVTSQEAKKRFMSTQSPLQAYSIKYCKDCGKQLLADTKFCSECAESNKTNNSDITMSDNTMSIKWNKLCQMYETILYDDNYFDITDLFRTKKIEQNRKDQKDSKGPFPIPGIFILHIIPMRKPGINMVLKLKI